MAAGWSRHNPLFFFPENKKPPAADDAAGGCFKGAAISD
jgi:hypothetical protein